MPQRIKKFLAVLMLASIMSGCLGLGHVRVNVPVFEVSGVVIGDENTISPNAFYIVVPEFYGVSGAFVSLVNGNLRNDSLYQWKEVYISKDKVIDTKFNAESRYIGSMFPFTHSKDTMERRIVFIWRKGFDDVYKVTMHGAEASVEKTNMKYQKNILPESLQGDIEKQWGGPREKQIEEEIDFYRRVNWEKTEILKIIHVSRNSQLDKLQFELIINGNS
jgi:hypothetical protein